MSQIFREAFFPMASLLLRAIRGATTVDADTPEAIAQAIVPLVGQLMEKNQITNEQIVMVFFSLTDDIHSEHPARVARLTYGWQEVPIFSAIEPRIDGLPDHCVRMLIQFYTEKEQSELVPVYLNGAVALRPDLFKGFPPPPTLPD